MIQASGLTKVYRRGRRPAVFDLGFDVRPGSVTALLGPEDAGKTTTLRLMLQLERGLGVTVFDGRTYRRLRQPEREVGVLLPTAYPGPGSPGRTARGHLRMLAAAIGVPARRADELLEQTNLAGAADQRLRTFSVEMARRLGIAVALLGDPKTLLLDAPTTGLPGRGVEWLHEFIRTFRDSGGTVLLTTRSPQEAAQLADRVVTLADGQQVADQSVAEFRRTRLHPEVAVRGPQMARLADLLTAQGADVRPEGGVGLAVSGLGRTEIGELAYRNGIMLHELADRVVEQPAPCPARLVPLRMAPTPTVQLRRMAAIAVGGRPALPALRLRRPMPDRAADASHTMELPAVLVPLPMAAGGPADDTPGSPSNATPVRVAEVAEATTVEPLLMDAAPTILIPQPPAPEAASGVLQALAPAFPAWNAETPARDLPAPAWNAETPARDLPAFDDLAAFDAESSAFASEPPTVTDALTSPIALISPSPSPSPGHLTATPNYPTGATALTAAAPADPGEPTAVPSPAPLPPVHGLEPLAHDLAQPAIGHDPQPLTGPDHWNG